MLQLFPLGKSVNINKIQNAAKRPLQLRAKYKIVDIKVLIPWEILNLKNQI